MFKYIFFSKNAVFLLIDKTEIRAMRKVVTFAFLKYCSGMKLQF